MRGRMHGGFGGVEGDEGYGRGPMGRYGSRRYAGMMGFPVQRGFVGLRYWILNLTSRREMTGAEIMSAMSEMSMGGWSPSPGNLYPALKSMEEEGYLESREEGIKKFYKASQKGRELLETFSWPAGAGFQNRQRMPVFEGVSGDADVLENLSGYIEYLKDHAAEIKGDKALRERLDKLKREFDALF
ncbi:MAG: PadR family transcriptional regulator [Candidatus Micrarchaeia archaeon]